MAERLNHFISILFEGASGLLGGLTKIKDSLNNHNVFAFSLVIDCVREPFGKQAVVAKHLLVERVRESMSETRASKEYSPNPSPCF